MRHLFLALLSWLFATSVLAKDEAPLPGFPLPANTPGVLLLNMQKDFVEFNPARNDPRLGMLPQYALAKAAQDDEARVAWVRESLQDAKLGDHYSQLLLANMGQIAPAANVVVLDEPWTDEQAYEHTRDSDGLYFVLQPFHGFQLGLQGVGAWLQVVVLRVQKKPNGKFLQTPLRVYQMKFVHAFEHLRLGASTMSSRVWMAMPPADVEAMIRDSMEQVRQMLLYQFSPEGLAEFDREVKGEKIEYRGSKIKARLVRQGEGWVWLRTYLVPYLVGEQLIPDARLPEPVPADDPRVMKAARKR